MAGYWDKFTTVTPPVEQDKPWYDDAREVGRQVAAGAAVDLPRMVGQAARWVAPDGSAVDEWGRGVVERADERAAGWEPDLEGRGPVASTLIKGGRAVAPMAPAIAASVLPGGQWVGPAVAAAQFGASAGQDTEDKLRLQGIDDATATRAGWNSALIQGPLEGVATAVGARAFTAARPLLGLGSRGAAGAVARATDTRVLKPLAKGMALNLVAQPTTEVLQDVGTELNERAYGATPEDLGEIAADSAQGAVGLTLLLGPFAGAANVSRARRNQALKEALYNPNTPEDVRNRARDIIVERATRDGVSAQEMDAWLDQQFEADDARVAAERLEREESSAIRLRQARAQVPQGTLDAGVLDRTFGTDSAPMDDRQRAAYEAQFEAAAAEGSGVRAGGTENGFERELSALEMMQGQAGLATLGEATDGDPTANTQGAAAAQTVMDNQAQAMAQAQAAQAPPTPEQQRLNQVKQTAAQVAQAAQARDQRAANDFGITKPAAQATYGDLEQAHSDGLIDDQQFATAAGMLAGNATGLGQVRKELAAIRRTVEQNARVAQLQAEQTERVAKADADQRAADAAKLQQPAAPSAPILTPAPVPAERTMRRAPRPEAPAATPAAAPPAAPAVRSGDVRQRIAGLLRDPGASPALKQRVQAATGFELTADPDSGAPVLVQTGSPRAMADVAREAKVSRAAISKQLGRYGLTEAEIDLAVANDAQAIGAQELGIGGQVEDGDGGAGFRVENSASKATNIGLMDGRNLSAREQAAQDQADKMLAEAPAETASVQDEFAEKRRELARQEAASVLARRIATPEGQAARTDWDDMKSDAAPAFDAMPDGYKEEWLVAHKALTEEFGNEYEPFQQAVNDLERDFFASAEGRAASEAVRGVRAPDEAGTGTGQGAGRGPGRTRGATDAGNPGEVRQEVARLSTAAAARGTTVEAMRASLDALMPLNSERLVLVQSVDQLPADIQQSIADVGPAGGRVQGFVVGGRAYLVADNIRPGAERAVFLHEVGSHMGMEDLLPTREFMRLVRQVRTWADRQDDSLESRVAQRAIDRVGNAGTQDDQVLSELVAYFVEEAVLAGVNPTAADHRSAIGRWMQALVSALKTALRKLGVANPTGLTAQDVVNLAYGAAHVALQEDSRVGEGGSTQFSIADRLPPAAREAQGTVVQALRDVKSKALLWGAFTKDLAAKAASLLPSTTAYIEQMEAAAAERMWSEREVERILDLYEALPAGERGAKGTLNAFIKASTMEKKWGYKPDFLPDAQVDEATAERYQKLSAPARQLVQAVFRHGHENLQALKKAISDNVNSEFDALIRAATTPEEASRLRDEKAKSLEKFRTLQSLQGNWPYAPLKRFGKHVVVGMSQAYIDAEQAGDQATMDRLKEDANHYYVAFRDTKNEARALRDEIGSRFAYADNFEKDDAQAQMYGGRDVLGAFQRLRKLVEDTQDANLTGNTSKALTKLMVDLQLTLLGEQSARQAERNRRGVAGADDDMMRAFATQGRAMAHFISSLKASGQVQDQLQAMKNEADARKPGREERRDYYNELLKRHVMGLDYEPTPMIDRALGASAFMLLLTSPAYYLTNATQTMVVSLPSIAGRHGYAQSAAALARAYADVLPLVKDGRLAQDDYSALPADVRNQVQQLTDGGFIDISLESDLGRWRSDATGPAAVFGRTVDKLRSVSQTVESVNRLTTAIAALRLERETGSGNEVKYAGKVIYDTHGDYSGFNSPRLMRYKAGRLATQFRKFQLIQISLYAKLLRDAFKGASADERLVARKTLAFNLSHMMLLGGLLGLPGATLFGSILGMAFGDDDEPDNPEQTLRRIIGDEVLADLLTKGVPKALGLDLSGRLGAGNMLSVQPFADGSISREGYSEYAVAMMGPFLGGLLPKAADGIDQMSKGNYWQGLEMLMPKGFADASKSLRFGVEGVTNRRGDTLVQPGDVSWAAHVGQLVGLPTTQLSDRSTRASAAFKADEHFNARVTAIKRSYTDAYRSNDTDAMQEARNAWASLQEARVRNGYKRQPVSELLKAPHAQRQRERNTAGGVQFTRSNEGMVRGLGQ